MARGAKSNRRTADKYDLYQRAVQEPEADCRFFDRVYRKAYGRRPLVLREDFCGTAATCCQWVRDGARREAHGYDLDPEPLAWGRAHNLSRLPAGARLRVRLVEQDVLAVDHTGADVIAAQNFSYFGFRTREKLLEYFRAARANLAPQGVLVLDIMGGPEVLEEDVEEHKRMGDVTYVWEQERFDPIHHRLKCHIHFKLRGGGWIRRAFSYDWRLWTIPEVRELLDEAGFCASEVYWEDTGSDGEGNGVFRKRRRAESDPAWVSYVVAIK